MVSQQDVQILTALFKSSTPQTVVTLAKATKIQRQQLRRRLDILAANGAIVCDITDGVRRYTSHPALAKAKAWKRIAGAINEMVGALDDVRPVEPEGAKALAAFLIDRVGT